MTREHNRLPRLPITASQNEAGAWKKLIRDRDWLAAEVKHHKAVIEEAIAEIEDQDVFNARELLKRALDRPLDPSPERVTQAEWWINDEPW